MVQMAALFGANPAANSDLKRLYDPRAQSTAALRDIALSGAPAQGGWGEALARVFAGGLAGRQMRRGEQEQAGKEAQAAAAMENAMRLGQGWAPETRQYKDEKGNPVSVDWQGQEGSNDKMVQALMANTDTAPIGMSVQGALMDNKMATEAKLAELFAASQAKANEPITPYQREQLAIDRKKAENDNGISMTMPDGSVVQIGGKRTPMREFEAQASSRSNLIANGLKMLEENVGNPQVNPWRSAAAETVSALGPLGEVAANKIKSDAENLASAGRDSAIEGLASAVTGAGVTKDQFTRFKNMLPKAGESEDVRRQKFDNAYSFLLNQTNIAGPVADQLRQEVMGRNQSTGGLGMPEQGSNAAPARISDKAQFDALPKGTKFVAPDGSIRVKP